MIASAARGPNLHSLPVEFGARAAAEELQRAVLADRVRTLEKPVLPCRQTTEQAGMHRLGSGKAQARLHAGERIGRKAGAFLERQPDLVVPVQGVPRDSSHSG